MSPLPLSLSHTGNRTSSLHRSRSPPLLTSVTHRRRKSPQPPSQYGQSTEKHPAKRSVENNSDDKAGGDRTSPGAGEDHTRDVKRHKKLKYGLFDMAVKINGCTQPNVAVSKLESKFENLSGAKAPTISYLCNANRSICAFCQCSGLTDVGMPELFEVCCIIVIPNVTLASLLCFAIQSINL
ncbi:unnamed protein product [Camellia sinensis]